MSHSTTTMCAWCGRHECTAPETCEQALAWERGHVHDLMRFDRGVQALLGVLNDIGGGNPWNYNVITEAAEDALRAALKAMGEAA